MSQENVELVKRAIDAFNRRDVDGIVECVNPDVEWFPAMPVTFGGGAFRGPEGCSLGAEDRPNLCVRFACRELEAELRASGDWERAHVISELGSGATSNRR